MPPKCRHLSQTVVFLSLIASAGSQLVQLLAWWKLFSNTDSYYQLV